jgi:Transmembrane secretion effector
MIGTWMQNVGVQWLLVSEPGAETLVAMVQAAAMLAGSSRSEGGPR